MLTAKQLRELIQEQLDTIEAMQQLATEEDREFTSEEQTEFESIMGRIDDLRGKLTSQERYEQIRAGVQIGRPSTPIQTGTDTRERVPRGVSGLRAYRGEQAQEHAYRVGNYLAATLWGNEHASQWCNDHGLSIRGALSGADNSLGGFLVPEEMEMAIINLREMYGVFRREAKVVPMGSDTKNVPRRTSGLTAYFLTDNTEVTASDKAWDNVQLVAKKMGALAKWSSELNEDAIISIADDLTDEIAYAFANKEDECGFNGDGTSTYGGIVGVMNAMNAGSIKDAATGNTAFSTLDLADFETVVGALPQYAAANAKWYVSRVGFWASMARLMDAGGGNTIGDLSGGRQMMFLGYPVVITQVLNAVTTAQTDTNILAFGDLRMASTLGNRRGISVKVSDQRYLEYDQIGILGTQRVDINVHEKGTSTAAGAMIVMATPSS